MNNSTKNNEKFQRYSYVELLKNYSNKKLIKEFNTMKLTLKKI